MMLTLMVAEVLTIPIPKNTNVRIIATQPFLLFPPYNSPCNGRRPPIP